MLNKNVEEKRIFRIEKEKRVFYRINDFPINVNTFLVLLDCVIKEKELVLSEKSEKAGEDITQKLETSPAKSPFFYFSI